MIVKSSRRFVCSSSNLAHARPRQYNIQITRSNNNMWPRAACTRWRGFLGDQLEQWTDTDLHGSWLGPTWVAGIEMMQPPHQPRAREQFAAQLLTLVLTDRPAIGADTGRGRGAALIIRGILILLPYSILTSRDISQSVNISISAQIYLAI